MKRIMSWKLRREKSTSSLNVKNEGILVRRLQTTPDVGSARIKNPQSESAIHKLCIKVLWSIKN